MPCSPVRKSGLFGSNTGLSRDGSCRGGKALGTRSPSRAHSNSKVQGLEQLDNLCKLMEELSALKHQNSKLQKKVKTLEDEKDVSISSVTSLSQQNSPEIAIKLKSPPVKKTPKDPSKRMSVTSQKEQSATLSLMANPSKDSRSKSFSVLENHESRPSSVVNVSQPGSASPRYKQLKTVVLVYNLTRNYCN